MDTETMPREPCFIPACGLPELHDGPHESIEPLDRWRPAPDGATCSYKGCDATAVLQLNRRQRRRGGVRDVWWSYCEEHNYGRVEREGRVFFRWEA